MSSLGWVVDKETFTYDEAMSIAHKEGFFYGFPPAALMAMRNHREDGDWLSPSAAGGCPRRRVLEPLEPFYTDLIGAWSPGLGTAAHKWLEPKIRSNMDRHVSEVWLTTTLDVQLRDGRTVPYKLQGTCDYYDLEHERGYDYKTVSEFDYWHNGRRERVQRDLPSESHLIQANLYAFLLRRNQMPVKEYYLWYARLDKSAERRPHKVALWEDEECYHIACELAEPLAWYKETGELPQNKFDSKNSLCRYCPVKAACRQYAKDGK
jgi:hypothetical protein